MEDNPLIRQSAAEQRSLWLVKFCRTSPENVARLESQIARGEKLVAKGFVFECEDMELALCKFFSARDDIASGKPDPLAKDLFFLTVAKPPPDQPIFKMEPLVIDICDPGNQRSAPSFLPNRPSDPVVIHWNFVVCRPKTLCPSSCLFVCVIMDINDANASESVSRLDLEIYEVYDDYHARLIRPERTYARRRWVILVVGYLDSFLETTYRLELDKWRWNLERRRWFASLCQ